jgi:RNA polymerase sigma factor (sigma-70 family)
MNAQSNHFRVEGATSFAANDAVLWKEFKNGNTNSFSIIYRNYIQVLYSYGLQVVKDPELVEDCIQDLFIYLWDNKDKLGATDNIKFYLFKSLRRRLVIKCKSKSKEELSNDLTLHPSNVELSYEHTIVAVQTEQSQQEMFKRSMIYLTKRQREAIYLRFYDNLSFQEIADVMTLGLKSTYNLISKALEVLRQYLHFLLLVLLTFL